MLGKWSKGDVLVGKYFDEVLDALEREVVRCVGFVHAEDRLLFHHAIFAARAVIDRELEVHGSNAHYIEGEGEPVFFPEDLEVRHVTQ